MDQINEGASSVMERYCLPHHAGFKSASSTTSSLVVFDGSCRSNNGIPLNDKLLAGPTIQKDLYSIVLRFRTYPIAFTADTAKRYRQVRIHQDDRKLQRILWRRSVEKPLRKYEMSTVTYGTVSAPYLGTCCLQQLAEDESNDFALAPEALANNFFGDDVLCGVNTIEDALKIQQELTALLGQFPASHPGIFEAVPPDCREIEVPIQLDNNEGFKILGLLWHPLFGQFLISKGTCVQKLCETKNPPLSKRIISSSIVAAIFDPLSLISPVVVYKIFLQQLWLHKLDLDDQ